MKKSFLDHIHMRMFGESPISTVEDTFNATIAGLNVGNSGPVKRRKSRPSPGKLDENTGLPIKKGKKGKKRTPKEERRYFGGK